MTHRAPASKILSREEVLAHFGPAGSDRPGTLVFTNGCFEILHPGHVTYLDRARDLGDALVVGVNTDGSARRLAKGAERPYVHEEDRALVVAALESVDAVCLFDEDTPADLVAALLPDVLVKGADYALKDVAGRDAVEAAGGHVELIPLVWGHSTTDLITRIKEL